MTTETKFTPGPWKVEKDLSSYSSEWLITMDCGDRYGLAIAETVPVTGKEIANAYLIAAAPDGYALAKLVMEICGNPKGISESGQEELYEAALQYAKKARGES